MWRVSLLAVLLVAGCAGITALPSGGSTGLPTGLTAGLPTTAAPTFNGQVVPSWELPQLTMEQTNCEAISGRFARHGGEHVNDWCYSTNTADLQCVTADGDPIHVIVEADGTLYGEMKSPCFTERTTQ